MLSVQISFNFTPLYVPMLALFMIGYLNVTLVTALLINARDGRTSEKGLVTHILSKNYISWSQIDLFIIEFSLMYNFGTLIRRTKNIISRNMIKRTSAK